MVIVSFYKPPNIKFEIAQSKLNSTIESINSNSELFIVGDMNVDYKITHGPRFQKLKNFETTNMIKQYINTTTRPKEKSATAIDHIYSNSKNISKIGTLLWKPADHSATFIVRKQVKIAKHKEFICTRRAKDFDPENIKIDFENENWSEFENSNDVNIKWEILISKIRKVLDRNCPVRTFKRTISREKWVTDELLCLLDLRDSAIKKALNSKRSADWGVANTLRKETRKEMERAKNNYIKEILQEYEKDPRKFWGKVTPSINTKKAKLNMDYDMLDEIASKNLASKFNSYFSTIGKNLDNKLEKHNPQKHPFNTQPHRNIPPFKLEVTTIEEVKKHTQNISIYKGSEIEEISTYFVKGCFLILADKLTDLMNTSITTGKVPIDWKTGRLNPIFKGDGDKSDSGNYRPITLLPLPVKILEKIVNGQIRKFIEENKLYSEHQYGFRSALSTADAVEKVIKEIVINQNNGKHVMATFLDLRKAFDVVNHNILLQKLKHQYNFDDNTINWFTDYLSDRHQYTKINRTKSGLEDIVCGVPQGSVLGPTLFTLYINDLENVFSASKVFLYADDTVILTFHDKIDLLVDEVNKELSFYYNWLLYNRLTINAKKSNTILFKGFGQRINCRLKDIELGGEKIAYTQSYKYLGVWLDSHFKFDIHIKKVSRDVSFRLSKLFRIRNSITEKIAIKIYKVMILPLIDYCDTVYCSGRLECLKKLNVLQNKALRIVGKLHKRTNTTEIMAKHEILDLKKRRLLHILQYAHKLSKNENELKFITKKTRFNEGKLILRTLPTHSDCYLKSLDYTARVYWNELPLEVHLIRDKASFNTYIRRNLDDICAKLKKYNY